MPHPRRRRHVVILLPLAPTVASQAGVSLRLAGKTTRAREEHTGKPPHSLFFLIVSLRCVTLPPAFPYQPRLAVLGPTVSLLLFTPRPAATYIHKPGWLPYSHPAAAAAAAALWSSPPRRLLMCYHGRASSSPHPYKGVEAGCSGHPTARFHAMP